MTKRQSDFLLAFLLAVLVFSLFFRLDLLALKFEEPRRALVSLEMIRTGDWLHPSIYGRPYFNKPPVYNWVLALFISTFGYDNWVVRLPTVLSLLIIGVVHHFYFRDKIGLQSSLWSAIFFVTSVNIYYYFSFQGEIDMFYTLIIYLQVLSIIHFFHRKQYWQLFLWSYLLTALGFLTKGVPSIGFQGLTLIGMMTVFRKFRWFFSVPHLVSGVLAVFIMASYFLIYDATGGQAEYYVSKLFFEGTRRTVNHQQSFKFLKTFLTFVPLMAYLLSPWLPLGLLGLTRPKIQEQWQNPWLKYALVFLIFNLPLYWFSAGTRDRYLYMFLPFAMMWIVGWVFQALDKPVIKKGSGVFFGMLGLGALAMLFTQYNYWPEATVALISFIILFGLISTMMIKTDKLSPLHSWLIVLIVLRLGFNVLVYDDRSKTDQANGFLLKANKVLNLTEGHPVMYFAPVRFEQTKLPLIDQNISFSQVDRLNYTFTYYYNRQSGEVIKHSEYLTPGHFYIMQSGLKTTIEHQIIMTMELAGTEYTLIKT
jgi:4-amino-4-deoxy-L-arabinose transferase-like glycosyltransferase